MNIFERYLSVWVSLSMVLGVGLGLMFPYIFQTISQWEIGKINLVVVVLIWFMIIPMMMNIKWSGIKESLQYPKGLILTVIINWLVKPFTMALFAYIFFYLFYKGFMPQNIAQEYTIGLILLGAAPCTAMVFVWSRLVGGNAHYTLLQVVINDLIMLIAFAPIVALLLGVNSIIVPWDTLFFSLLLYICVPLILGVCIQKFLQKQMVQKLKNIFLPLSSGALLLMIILLFAFQADRFINSPLDIVLIALPILVQTYGIFFITYCIAKWIKLPYNQSAPAALIGASNFFELAVAVAITLLGLESGAAFATVVGVLVEVPVMLHLVSIAKRTKGRFKN